MRRRAGSFPATAIRSNLRFERIGRSATLIFSENQTFACRSPLNVVLLRLAPAPRRADRTCSFGAVAKRLGLPTANQPCGAKKSLADLDALIFSIHIKNFTSGLDKSRRTCYSVANARTGNKYARPKSKESCRMVRGSGGGARNTFRERRAERENSRVGCDGFARERDGV